MHRLCWKNLAWKRAARHRRDEETQAADLNEYCTTKLPG
jgi:hypothetical protein